MKSNVSDCLELMAGIYRDATIRCSAEVSDIRDLFTLRQRTEKEGMSFLTITLPQFARDLERALANGFIDSTSFPGFRRVKGGAIPSFLQGMLSQIFSVETGRLFDEDPQDQTTVIGSVRQICLAFKKIELPCAPKRERKALASFREIERILSEFSLQDTDRRQFRRISDLLWGGMLRDFNHEDLTPRHGPGATAERVKGNQKYVWRTWVERLEPFFPFIGTAYPVGVEQGPSQRWDETYFGVKPSDTETDIEKVTFLTTDQELPVRVVFVPKTLKAPRVIAIEPVAMQYAQQAIRSFLYRKLESWHLTTGRINFRDQDVNQALALESSRTGRLATIDLSDASDRVPLDLVYEMLSCNPDFRDCVMACRSSSALLPDGVAIPSLKKFASMGSALCFPVEAMYFYTVCSMALLEAENLPATIRNLKRVSRSLYIYGDDILVPAVNAEMVLAGLLKYNCKPNAAKTFWTGRFRESCGVDAYCGEDITPVYFSHLLPSDRNQTTAIASWVAARNALYKRGYWATAQLIQDRIEQIVGRLPYVPEDSGGLGYFSYLSPSLTLWHNAKAGVVRWHSDYQRLEVRTLVVKAKARTEPLNGYPALAKSLLKLSAQVEVSGGSGLDVVEQRGAVTLKRRWVRA